MDFAIAYDILHSGWCPYGRKAEDGVIPLRYNLKETAASIDEQDADAIYKERTELNVKDSDGTLIIINAQKPMGGTLYTIEMAEKHYKPYFIVNLQNITIIEDIANWIMAKNIHKLNVAGPRASQTKDIYQEAYRVLQLLHTSLTA